MFCFIGLAPNFDNNMALIARGYPTNKVSEKDILIVLFNELIAVFPQYRKLIPEITEELLADILRKLNMKVRSKDIINIVMSRYNFIK